MNIRNYCLVVEHSAEKLVESVTAMIRDGYQPVGGCSVAIDPPEPTIPVAGEKRKPTLRAKPVFAQAMVRLVSAQDILGIVAPNPHLKINGG